MCRILSYRCGPLVTTLVIMFVFSINGVIIEKSTCTEETKQSLFYLALAICITGQMLMMCTALADSGTVVAVGPADEEYASLMSGKDSIPFCEACSLRYC